jgi:hypothetical protein
MISRQGRTATMSEQYFPADPCAKHQQLRTSVAGKLQSAPPTPALAAISKGERRFSALQLKKIVWHCKIETA